MGTPDLSLYWNADYNGTAVAFATTRKADRIVYTLENDPIPGVRLVSPDAVTVAQLLTTHDPDYVDAVITGNPYRLAASAGIGWDKDFPRAICASTGGTVAAVLEALATRRHTGTLSSGLHHAKYARGEGFCTFNGLAIAAKAARSNGARRVLIVDFDAHCGGGTASLIGSDSGIGQVDVSVIPYDSYKTTFDSDLRLWIVDPDKYLQSVTDILDGVAFPDEIDVVIYNAGMDPHERAGGVDGIDTEMLAERERIFYEWANANDLPVAFTLAGGYTSPMSIDELAGLHRLTISQAVASQRN